MSIVLNGISYPSPFIIGLTGGIGSGKTTVANLFIDCGIDVVDADIVAREVVAPGTKALNRITSYFGKDILLANGELNRDKLREHVFSTPEDKQWLNDLLHPIIREEIFSQLHQTDSPYCLLIAPLLFENKLHLRCHRTLVVDVDEATQLSRVLKRDNSSLQVIENIIASQMPRTERVSFSDDVIINQDKTIKQLEQEVETLDENYRELALKSANL